MAANHEGIPRRTSTDTAGDVARVLAKLEATGQDLTVNRILANASAVFRPYMLLASALMYEATLPADLRELVILHMAARRPNSYEWIEHDRIARRLGVPDDLIDALADGSPPDDRFEDAHHLAVALVDELLDGGEVSPSTFAAAAERWGVEGVIELLFTVGFWGGLVPLLLEGLGLDLPDSMRDGTAG
jgi:alkylhydroperoxidase family enzyme